MKGEKKMDK